MEISPKPHDLATNTRRIFSRSISTARNELHWFGYRTSATGRKNTVHLAALRNKYLGRRVFVLGNGPSLLKCDLKALNSELTIGSNAIFLLAQSHNFLPTFLTVEDRLVAEDRAVELNAVTGTTKLVPFDLRSFVKQDPSTIYVNFVRNYSRFPKFSANFANRVFWGGTVSYLNLQLAHFLGCSEIVLVGFDHSYRVRDQVRGAVIVSTRADENHFDPTYFGPGYRWHDPNVARMEQAYIKAREFLTDAGSPIYNATVGGHLEVFPRRPFETFVSKSEPSHVA
jgi:hypothetical protein